MVSIRSWNFSFRFMFTLGHNMKSTSYCNFQPRSLETPGWRVLSVTELNEGDPPAAIRCPPKTLRGPLQGQMLPCFQIALSHLGQLLLSQKLPFWNSHIKPWHQKTEVFTTPWRHYVSQSRDFALLSSRVRLEAEGPAQPVFTCQISTRLSSPWTPLMAQTVKRLPTMRETGFNPWVRKISWRRKWQPSSVFLPGKSHGPKSLVGYSPRGRKESDTTEQLHFTFQALSRMPLPWGLPLWDLFALSLCALLPFNFLIYSWNLLYYN